MSSHTPQRRACFLLLFGATLTAILLSSTSLGADVRLNGHTFTLPRGFTIEQVAGPPLVDRPIEADFDELGRLYVTDSSGSGDKVQKQLEQRPHRVVRLEDTTGNGHFDKRTIFADHMMFPEGAMWLDGSLYVAAPPSIWKLTDSKGDGVADQRMEWFAGKTLTGCANDLHGPYLGPDGWIYWCKGAFAEQTYARPGRPPLVTRAAHIFRCRPDGSGIEPVMTGGMDNPVEIAFTAGGERIFTTTFLQNPAGGRRDGLIHAIYGGVYGKTHDVINGHPRTGPDLMPVMTHLGPAAPCGLVRYESDAFGPEYRDNLFASLFNLHKVTRHVLIPDGSTFKTRDEDFLTCDSFDFHPTDVLEDADGSLLVIDTGGWYKLCCPTSQLGKPDVLGAIYRVRKIDAPHIADPRGLQLEWATLTRAQFADLLGDPRPAVRKRATQALARQGDAALDAIERVQTHSKSPLARLNAVWAATRIDSPRARAAVRAVLMDHRDETVLHAAICSAGLWRDHDSLPLLIAILEGTSSQNQRAAAEAIGRIGDPKAVDDLLAALRNRGDPVLEHSLIYAVIEIGDAKAISAGAASHSANVRRAAVIALDQLKSIRLTVDNVAVDLFSSDPRLRDTMAWIAGRHSSWGDALAAPAAERMKQADGLSPAERIELQKQLAGLAQSEPIQNLLATRAANASASKAERQLALWAMSLTRLNEAPESWVVALGDVLAGNDADLTAAAVSAARSLPAKSDNVAELTTPLLATASQKTLPPLVRLQAVSAVHWGAGVLRWELFEFVVTQLGSDQPVAQQLLAAEIIGRLDLTTRQKPAVIAALRTAGPLEIDRLLSAFDQTNDDAVGIQIVNALGNAKALKSLRPEAVRRHLAKFGGTVQKQAEILLGRLAPDAGKQKARLDELLAAMPAGDTRRGQALFNSTKTACASCHAIGYVGGNVGPDLTHVGQIRQPRDLLESIIFPSASFVQSFEPYTVVARTGETHYGILRKNDAEEVVLVESPTVEVRIPRKDVNEIRPGAISLMPEGFDPNLSPQELADLVTFLQACR